MHGLSAAFLQGFETMCTSQPGRHTELLAIDKFCGSGSQALLASLRAWLVLELIEEALGKSSRVCSRCNGL